ncbi:hypothetical protein FGG08_006917 [Glutinoglossum americanum]|uniref:Flavin-containing monooxygenase n=1 Tax=Glutinoglossum americanum TaxID=1670608 RepID=A0A9P8I0B3_9PEZI|nr:hypothetical protein FGG08_006917 [Glutinoglossum americanum]
MPSSTIISKKDGITYIPVVIIGGGASGIAMGCRLKQVLGFDQFRIFERRSGIGGVWTNTYPDGKDILRYLQDVCEKFKIVDKIQLDTDVSTARWLEEEELWEVTIAYLTPGSGALSARDRKRRLEAEERDIVIKRETVRCKVLVSAAGGLVEPNPLPPNVSGWEAFDGKIFHSACWDHNVDLTDKDIIVVGTGCSAIQLVPRLTKAPYSAKSVTQLMQSPPWIVPAPEPPFGREKWAKWSPTVFTYVPAIGWLFRQYLAILSEYDWRLFGGSEYNEREREKMQKKLLAHLYKTAPEKYHEILTPNYGLGCKRRVLDADWLTCLHDPKVELTTLKLSSVQSHGIVLGPERAYPPKSPSSKELGHEVRVAADIIVLANGFDTTQWLHPLELIGKNDVSLHDEWNKRGGPQAYNGTSMDGFPNFFILFGPNTVTGHTSVIMSTEYMINYSLKFIKPILEGDVSQVEVKREAEENYTRDIQEKLKSTVWMTGGCTNWYKAENGWNSAAYPYSQIRFALRSMFPTFKDWNIRYTSKGFLKQRLRRIGSVILSIAVIASILKARPARYSMGDIQGGLWNYLKTGIDALSRHSGIRVGISGGFRLSYQPPGAGVSIKPKLQLSHRVAYGTLMNQPPSRIPPVGHPPVSSLAFGGRQQPSYPEASTPTSASASPLSKGNPVGFRDDRSDKRVAEEPAGLGIGRQATVERYKASEEQGVPIPGRSHNNLRKDQQALPYREGRGAVKGTGFGELYENRYGQPSPVAFGEEAEGLRKLKATTDSPFRPHPVGGLKSSLTVQQSHTFPITHTAGHQLVQSGVLKPIPTALNSSSYSEGNYSESATQTRSQNTSLKVDSLAEDQEETLTYSDEAMSSSSPSPESWISSFCSLLGHEYFAEVSEDFIEDDFNLTGLQSQVPMYKEALEMILDVEPEEDDEEEEEEEEEDDDDEIEKPLGYRRAGDRRHMRVASDLSVIESSAELLYGLIHQRYITSRPGIQQMAEKYELSHFGTCPRVFCNGCRVLPVGYSDTPGLDTVKLFCPSCLDIYTPPNSRFQSVDGSFFGTTFGCLFFMTFPELEVGIKMDNINGLIGTYLPELASLHRSSIPESPPNQPATINGVSSANLAPGLGPGRIYEPRIYGFRVSERARSGPRMKWLRMRPTDVTELDETRKYYENHDDPMGEDQSPSVPVPRRKKAPVRRRRQIVIGGGGGSPMDTNGGVGEVG